MEPSDILLGLLLACSRLVGCTLLLTKDKVTDFESFAEFLSLKFGAIRHSRWPEGKRRASAHLL